MYDNYAHETSYTLTKYSRRLIERRLILDRPSATGTDKFSFKQVRASVCSPHTVLLYIISFMNGTMLFGLALFLPSIVNQLGFSSTRTQLISVPPFAAGFVCTLTFLRTVPVIVLIDNYTSSHARQFVPLRSVQGTRNCCHHQCDCLSHWFRPVSW